MAGTILSLKEALHNPKRDFATLGCIRWTEQSVVCSTHFAETQIEYSGKDYMLYMPLTVHATRCLERFLPHKRHLASHRVPKITILNDELTYRCAEQLLKRDIVIEELEAKLPLKDAIASICTISEAEELIASLTELQQMLLRADVAHNNVRVENIMLDSQNKAYLVRWYYATPSADNGQNDQEAFSRLKEQIMAQVQGLELHDNTAEYYTAELASEYKELRFLHEGLIAFQSNGLWGFMDSQQSVIIAPQYTWVNDFREGRAEVESAEGMGLIDKEGTLIIPTNYQIVDYDPRSGNSEVCKDGEWALFDYQGTMIRDWGEHELEF